MVVVSNSTPLIALSKIRKLSLLKEFFEEIVIPEEVYNEVVIRGGTLYGSAEVADSRWIHLRTVHNRQAVNALSLNLDRGEAEAIICAQELGALLLIDDRDGRNAASELGIPITGTIGVLLMAAEDGLIHFQTELDLLVASGFRLSEREYARIVKISERD